MALSWPVAAGNMWEVGAAEGSHFRARGLLEKGPE